jgi:hypothetical protein
MKKYLLFLAILAAAPLGAQDGREESVEISTNAAYLILSAVTVRTTGAMIVLPLECQIALNRSFALHPAVVAIWTANFSGGAQTVTVEAECAFAWRPEGKSLRGWYLSAGPGAALAMDSNHILVLANLDCGYQWLLGKGLLLGLGGGGRAIFDTSGGFLLMPDLKLRIGYAF